MNKSILSLILILSVPLAAFCQTPCPPRKSTAPKHHATQKPAVQPAPQQPAAPPQTPPPQQPVSPFSLDVLVATYQQAQATDNKLLLLKEQNETADIALRTRYLDEVDKPKVEIADRDETVQENRADADIADNKKITDAQVKLMNREGKAAVINSVSDLLGAGLSPWTAYLGRTRVDYSTTMNQGSVNGNLTNTSSNTANGGGGATITDSGNSNAQGGAGGAGGAGGQGGAQPTPPPSGGKPPCPTPPCPPKGGPQK